MGVTAGDGGDQLRGDLGRQKLPQIQECALVEELAAQAAPARIPAGAKPYAGIRRPRRPTVGRGDAVRDAGRFPSRVAAIYGATRAG